MWIISCFFSGSCDETLVTMWDHASTGGCNGEGEKGRTPNSSQPSHIPSESTAGSMGIEINWNSSVFAGKRILTNIAIVARSMDIAFHCAG